MRGMLQKTIIAPTAVIALLLVLASCSFVSSLPSTPAATPSAQPVAATPQQQSNTVTTSACTHTIPAGVVTVNGKSNYTHVQPGDTICIPAGTREAIQFVNLKGEEGKPITIRNEGGQVHIRGGQLRYGITLENNSYLRLTGTGVSEKCGSPYPVDEQECGFVISGFAKAVEAINNPTDLEYDHIEGFNTTGATFKVLGDGRDVANHYVHHLYAHDTDAEGLYMGESGNDGDLNVIRGLEVSYNLVVRSGWDGINIKHTANPVAVHHNVIRQAGLYGVENQDQGLSIGSGGTGDYYNNMIIGVYGPGLNIRELPAGSKIYNNVIIDSGAEAIRYGNGKNVSFFNNTLIDNRQGGITGTGRASGEAFDNVIVGSPTAIAGERLKAENNFIGTLADAGFANAEDDDYSLRSDSPLIDQGRSTGLFPTFDVRDLPRPQGAKTDLGAYELEPTVAHDETESATP